MRISAWFLTKEKGVIRMKIKSQISNAIKKKLFNTLIINEEVFSQMAEKEILSDKQEKYGYDTNIDNIQQSMAVQTYKKELVIEHILDDKTYSFKNALLILNPYKISLLTAVLIFNTDMKCMVKYKIKGIRGSKDYIMCDDTYTTRHRVPITGLYENAYNIVQIYLLDENQKVLDSNKIMIHTPELKGKLETGVEVTGYIGDDSNKFMLVTGGYSGSTYAFDNNGNVRFILGRPSHPYGIHELGNGRFLYAEKYMRQPNYGNAHSVVMHEMDYMGRVHRTFLHPNGYHHWAVREKNSGNYLIASSSITDSFAENMIIEMNPKTGNVIRGINVNDLFDDTYVTRSDWAHINSFDYIPEEDCVIVSMRNIHTLAKISLRNNELIWLIANPKFYTKTEQKDKVLKPAGHIDWFFQQHAVSLLEYDSEAKKYKVILFDNHTANRRPVKYFDKVERSNVLILNIDEKNGTVSQGKRVPTSLSITRSNAMVTDDGKYIYAMCGNLKEDIDGCRAKIYKYDYDSGECVTEISCKKDFFSGREIQFDIKELSKTICGNGAIVVGNLKTPIYKDGSFDKFYNSDDIREYKKHTTEECFENGLPVMLRIVGDILQIYSRDHLIKKVYLYDEKGMYVHDFSDTEQKSQIFIKHKYYINVPLAHIKNGRYNIAVNIGDNIYKTGYWIKKRRRNSCHN